MTTLVFGHKSPDTDSTGSPIIWAWYLTETGTPASDIENVAKVTKESSSGAHESAKASHDLSQLAVELQGIVGGFKI